MVDILRKFDPVTEEELELRQRHFESATPEDRQEIAEEAQLQAGLEHGPSFFELIEEETDPELRKKYETAIRVAHAVREAGGLAMVFGGFVRDMILNKELHYQLRPKDIDLEIYGLSPEKVQQILNPLGDTNFKGQGFPIIILQGVDVAVVGKKSETESSMEKQEESNGDLNLNIEDAARRRDFTVNAMGMNPLTGEIIDKYGGLRDVRDKVLRAVNFETFKEDPLRVLRAAQFVGRLGFTVEEETAEFCRKLCREGELKKVAQERFFAEWEKLLVKSPRPSLGLEAARDLGVIDALYPVLRDMKGCKQEPDWHPEGDVWTHTLMVADEALVIARREKLSDDDSAHLLFSALLHDGGKPLTTRMEEKKGRMRITSPGHEAAGVAPAQEFLRSMKAPDLFINKVLRLVENHFVPTQYTEEKFGAAAIKHLVKRISPASLKLLVLLGEADAHGRGIWDDQSHAMPGVRPWNNYPSGKALLERARGIKDISVEGGKAFVRNFEFKNLVQLGLNMDTVKGDRRGLLVSQLEEAQLQDKIESARDLRLAKLMVFLTNSEFDGRHVEEPLLNGEAMRKEEMREFLQHRFWTEGLHDMGTLVMYHLLAGKPLPEVLERNKAAILTAHKHGPAWFTRLERDFYNSGWKSFYGKFEPGTGESGEELQKDFIEQATDGLSLIENSNAEYISRYNESLSVKPLESEKDKALYVTDVYPFEAGLMDGYHVMVQFVPAKGRVCVSVMDTDPAKVEDTDRRIRAMLPEFAASKKVGYLFARNKDGNDSAFTEADAERVYRQILEI